MIATTRVSRGFSLLELLVSLAILALLMGSIFAATAGVREKGRQVVCISNLRQIGQAIAMYRMDFGGHDPNGGPMMPEQVGLPPSTMAPVHLERYIRHKGIWICTADAQVPSDIHQRMPEYTSYVYGWPPKDMKSFNWPDTSVYYQMSQPIFIDDRHERAMGIRYDLVLRLDGRVKGETWTMPRERFPYPKY